MPTTERSIQAAMWKMLHTEPQYAPKERLLSAISDGAKDIGHMVLEDSNNRQCPAVFADRL